eukprot:Selendium_serpulae@DN6867_c0_g1_i1.p1
MAAGARITQSYTREVATRNNNIGILTTGPGEVLIPTISMTTTAAATPDLALFIGGDVAAASGADINTLVNLLGGVDPDGRISPTPIDVNSELTALQQQRIAAQVCSMSATLASLPVNAQVTYRGSRETLLIDCTVTNDDHDDHDHDSNDHSHNEGEVRDCVALVSAESLSRAAVIEVRRGPSLPGRRVPQIVVNVSGEGHINVSGELVFTVKTSSASAGPRGALVWHFGEAASVKVINGRLGERSGRWIGGVIAPIADLVEIDVQEFYGALIMGKPGSLMALRGGSMLGDNFKMSEEIKHWQTEKRIAMCGCRCDPSTLTGCEGKGMSVTKVRRSFGTAR